MIFCDFWETTQVVDLAITLSNDYEMEWTVDQAVTIGSMELQSSEGPAAVMYKQRLHLLYKGKSSEDIWMAVYEPLTKAWLSNSKVRDMPGGSFHPQTNKGPSAAVYGEILYVVFKSASSDSIRLMLWDGREWRGGNEIKIPSPGRDPQTNNSPYLAYCRGELMLVHKWKDNDEIHWSRFNGSWSGGHRIEVSDNKDRKVPGTNKRPALIEYGDLVYLLFKGSHSNNLLQCTYDGTAWKGNQDIRNEDEDFTPKSDEGPGVANFGGSIFMFYKVRRSTTSGSRPSMASRGPKTSSWPW